MRKLIIDPQYGMSGDMLSAALIDLGAKRETMIAAMVDAAQVIGGASVSVRDISRLDKKGIILDITLTGTEPDIDASELYTHLEDALLRLGVRDGYYDFALRALDILSHAEFEAHQHNMHHAPVSHNEELHGVHLHEAKDIIIDLVGATIGLQELEIDLENAICLSPIMTGGGKIRFSHGETNAPAPATASIISSYALPVKHGPVERELFTPTGAAIVASLNPLFEERSGFDMQKKQPLTGGIGFGTLDLASSHKIPNALFVYAYSDHA
jgi:uncharacterized protein (DUF111 family)